MFLSVNLASEASPQNPRRAKQGASYIEAIFGRQKHAQFEKFGKTYHAQSEFQEN